MALKLEIVNRSDKGKTREYNEDSTVTDMNNGLVILADGMGGYNAGEIASAIAVTEIHHDLKKGLAELKSGQVGDATGLSHQSSLIRDVIKKTNSTIHKKTKEEPQCEHMGTTIVVGLFIDQTLVIAYVGDSRLYRFRNDELDQMTRDHSLIQTLVDRGLYTSQEAKANTPKNMVTRALGVEIDVDVDLIEEKIVPDDIYLLCSDGLNDMLNDEEIRLTISKYNVNLEKCAEELVEFANLKGGKDNISVILVRILGELSSL